MVMDMNRREFLMASGAALLMAGCKTRSLFGSPDMKFGVVSEGVQTVGYFRGSAQYPQVRRLHHWTGNPVRR